MCNRYPPPLTIVLLRSVLRYDPETGRLFWRERPLSMFKSERTWRMWNTRFAGVEAFTADDGNGYRHGKIFGRVYKAHRVAWAVHYGAWPDGDVDHIDGDEGNNRPGNMRDVSRSVNRRNSVKQCNNSSGVNGVYFHARKGKWQARIRVQGYDRHLGHFADINDAIAARKAADVENGFTERHGT